MRLKNLIISISVISVSALQNISAATATVDDLQRGYYDRPYLRYEAEPGECAGINEFLLPPVPYSQQPLQAEASNLTAANLSSKGDNVEWVCRRDADALTLRFSIPDGSKAPLSLLVDGKKIAEIDLDSHWSWQYIPVTSQSKHPDKDPSGDKFARMRFDEVAVLLPEIIRKGSSFSLVKEADNDVVYTIDFVELEKAPDPVRFEDLEGDKIIYQGDGSTLQSVIDSNPGKTIFIPEGTYTIPRRILINAGHTALVGAGMWYTNLYFSASSASRRTYSARGFESYSSNITLEGFSVNSASNIRYYDNNESYGIGKGLQGSFGAGSVVRDVRIEHFECGAWIGDYGGVASDGLRVENCRFRNNYADGINLCSGTKNAVVTHCSFRNNGDDDMASWSTGNVTSFNEFSYCTAEHNWRASSLAFFGGKGNKAHHIHISDGMESGARVTADFQGTGFDSGSSISLSDITIERCGTQAGAQGTLGDFWGNRQPSLLIQAGYWYDINNLDIRRVAIYDTRNQGIAITSNGGRRINGLELHDVLVSGIDGDGWGIYMQSNLVGSGHYSNLKCEGINEPSISNVPVRFDFTDVSAICEVGSDRLLEAFTVDGGIRLAGVEGQVNVCDISGRHVACLDVDGDVLVPLPAGTYIVCACGYSPVKVTVAR